MRTGDKRIFRNDPEKLIEMIGLRDSGWSWLKLAVKYKCDHTSLIYQYRKFKNVPKKIKMTKGKLKIKEGVCPKCELLLRSEFSCEYCKDLPGKKQHGTS